MGLFSKSKHSQKRQVYTYNREVQKAIPPVLHEPEKPLSDDEAIPPKMWERCPGCNSILYSEDVHKTLMVCTQCGYHFRGMQIFSQLPGFSSSINTPSM